MSINVARVTVECDGCGKQFRVGMELARPLSHGFYPTVYELAEDFIRGGVTADGDQCAVIADMHLCQECTYVADDIGEKPSRDQIVRALDARGRTQ